MKKIKVAQFGTWGMCHSDHIMSTIRNMPDLYEVVGICEPNERRRQRAEKTECYKGLNWLTEEEILNNKELDAVLIETHETEQDKAALKFAEAGFNIHLEKPGGATSDFEKAVNIAAKNGTLFHMGYMYRYNPAIRRAVELVKSGALGKILYTEVQMNVKYSCDAIAWLKNLPGGMMYYLGCHLVDLMYAIMGEPKEIIPMNFSTGIYGTDSLDGGFVLFKYNTGISFAKSCASEVNGDARRQLVIAGENGTIEINPLENPLEIPGVVCADDVKCKITFNDHVKNVRDFDLRSEIIKFPPFGRYDEMMIDFAKKINGEKETEYTYDYELAVHKMLMKSIEEFKKN